MRLAVVVMSASLLAAGCPRSSPPVVEAISLSMNLRPKPSCDITPVQYATDCLAAFEVIIAPTGASPPHRFCQPLEPAKRPANLGILIGGDDPIIQFGSMTGRGEVVFKVRGIHLEGLAPDADPCEQQNSQWLFWGESLPLSIEQQAADGGVVEVIVPLDCRDCQGGCDSIGVETQCPASLPPSFCVPFSPGFSCERRCTSDGECFESSLDCDHDAGRCDPSSSNPLTGIAGGFCGECDDTSECIPASATSPGFTCVSSPSSPLGLCTQSCPDARCVSGATCRRVGAGLVVRSGSSGADDGGP